MKNYPGTPVEERILDHVANEGIPTLSIIFIVILLLLPTLVVLL